MMVRRHTVLAVSAALALGAVGLALLPAQRPEAASAGARPLAVAGIASPSPDLLERLDAELAPPSGAAVEPPAREPLPDPAASVEPAALVAGVGAAAPAAGVPSAAAPIGAVGPSAVNLRAGPSSAAAQLSVLQPGERVRLGETSGGWVNVTRADGQSGWVYSAYLADGSKGQLSAATDVADASPALAASSPPARPRPPRAVVRGAGDGDLQDRLARIGSRLPGYARPSDTAPSIFTFTPGDEVRIAEVRGNWLRVETEDGFSAWIRR